VTSDWKSSDGAIERVRDLLVEAGLPLELSVEASCVEFASAASIRTQVHVDTRKLVYSMLDEPEVYREIDQMLDFYDELEVGSLGIQLMCNVPIECKYRKDIEYFAFPASSELASCSFPVGGVIAGSQYARLLAEAHPPLKDSIQAATVTSLKIAQGATPQAVHSENTIYNAAGALYDFVATDSITFTPQSLDVLELQTLDDLGVLSHVRRIAEANNAGGLSAIRQYAWKVPDEVCEQYKDAVYGDRRVYHSLIAYLPVVCVGGPLHAVQWSPEAGIGDFTKLDACVVEIRKRDWPGKARGVLLWADALAPALVTNLEGLPSCLALAEEWFMRLRKALIQAPPDIIDRWPLESALMSVGTVEYSLGDFDGGYRSDLVY